MHHILWADPPCRSSVQQGSMAPVGNSGSSTCWHQEVRESIAQTIKTIESSSTGQNNRTKTTNNHSEWLLDIIKKAIADLELFWTHIWTFSSSDDPDILDITLFKFTLDAGGNFKSENQHLCRLQSFHAEAKKFMQSDPPGTTHRVQLVCSVRDAIYPGRTALSTTAINKVRQEISKKFPNDQQICRSALVIALTLTFAESSMSEEDLHSLLEAFNPAQNPQLLSFLPQLPSSTFGFPIVPGKLHHDSADMYTTLQSSTAIELNHRESATKVLRLPDKFPVIRNETIYMEAWRPHSQAPDNHTRASLYGAKSDSVDIWLGILVLTDRNTATTIVSRLTSTLERHCAEMHHMLDHWVYMLWYVYIIAINDVRLALRESMAQIELLKYQNTSQPTITFTSICAMYLNHIEYMLRAFAVLDKEITKFPRSWRLHPPSLAMPWVAETRVQICTVKNELSDVHTEIKKIRNLVAQQHDILQVRRGTILTILVSIFVPMSFVATFFGMNTVEINGSTWPLRFYFASAIPLAVLTVIVPLYFMKVFAFLVRVNMRYYAFIREFLIFASLVFNITADGLYAVCEPQNCNDALLGLNICAITISAFAAYFALVDDVAEAIQAFRVERSFSIIRKFIWQRRSLLWLLLIVVTTLCSFWLISWVELIGFGIYYIDKAVTWYIRRRKKKRKAA